MSDESGLEPSSVQFDALIELVATDDTGDHSNFHIAPEGAASTGLRDASGKLDYAKIRSLFLQRRGNDDVDHIPSSDPAPHHEPNSGPTLPQIVVQEPTALMENSFPPKTLPERKVVESRELETAPRDSDVHHTQSVLSPEASKESIARNLEDALSKANEEVAELRRQVLQLEIQTTKLFQISSSEGKEEWDQGDTRGYNVRMARPVTPTLSNVQDAFATEPTVPTVSTDVNHSDADRAIQFLIRTDELVWRRTRYPNAPPAPVLSQSNIDAIIQRLTLWESIVRALPPAR
ncbi:hypothetical protein BJV78DRAFT_1283203 [Lactifluus subvellereus]|nr:hypothetical protein BJV78DRAFT_1283203 [Lactifluus subvellereus]